MQSLVAFNPKSRIAELLQLYPFNRIETLMIKEIHFCLINIHMTIVKSSAVFLIKILICDKVEWTLRENGWIGWSMRNRNNARESKTNPGFLRTFIPSIDLEALGITKEILQDKLLTTKLKRGWTRFSMECRLTKKDIQILRKAGK